MNSHGQQHNPGFLFFLEHLCCLFPPDQKSCHEAWVQQNWAKSCHVHLATNNTVRLKTPFVVHEAPVHATVEPWTFFSKFPGRFVIMKVFRNEELCQWHGKRESLNWYFKTKWQAELPWLPTAMIHVGIFHKNKYFPQSWRGFRAHFNSNNV